MFLEKTDRRIVPRWRDFMTASALGELDSVSGQVRRIQPSADLPGETLTAWRQNKTLWHGLDLISAAFTVGQIYNDDVVQAARFVRNRQDASPRAGFELAGLILDPAQSVMQAKDVESVQRQDIYRDIHALRARLIGEPRNAIAWVDLARLYAIVGNLGRAERAIDISARLAPDNRFIVRSAARFFVHSGQKDRALRTIRASDAVTEDPWLTAAEIGVSSYAKVAPHHARTGRRMLENENLSTFSKTELASALATAELLDGKSTTARKLFRQSLSSPTENSLAQAQWATDRLGELGFDFDAAQAQVPRSYEASTLREMDLGNWKPAVSNSVKWLQDQPFSTRPAAVASYLLSVIFEGYNDAEAILRSSLVSSPNDATLLNNLAFALLKQNKLDDAEAALAKAVAQGTDSASITLLGTWGLLRFRRGEYEEGRSLYLRAIERARLMARPKYEAMGMLYLAQEEVRVGLSTGWETLAKAERLARNLGEADVLYVLDRVLQISRQMKPR